MFSISLPDRSIETENKFATARTNRGHSDTATTVASTMSAFLASTYSLSQKTLFYHWNITGPFFFSLHPAFEAQYRELQSATDEIAERIRAIGYFSPFSQADLIMLSSIVEDTEMPHNDKIMVENLYKHHDECSVQAANVFRVADENKDSVSMDLLVRRMASHDKTAWMLKSFLAHDYHTVGPSFKTQTV